MHSLPCEPALWPRFSALLDAALDLPDSDRAAWLASLPATEADLKPTLERVLAGNAHAGLTLPPVEASFHPGACVGPYRLAERIGEGGMGEVWSATRDDDGPHREVALKLPHAEFLGGPFRLRFARERDTLAALTHPNIAQLYDAGSSADGHPYLALELVSGQPITEWCRGAAAPLERRIDLIRQVLDGLAYAHRRLIVHRDLKPSNVLVTEEGNAKLLDFGIAKLLHPDSAENATLTQPKARLATPAYAAPEQLDGGTITVATDLFSVGILLFELCTGHRPFTRIPTEADAAAAPLASQRVDPHASGLPDRRKTAARLRGDLDAVIGKAIALDPADRYPSAETFASDLRRWRTGLPVLARRTGWISRSRKFIRRNPIGVSLAAFLALALAGGTAGIAWQAKRAERQAIRATAIQDYLVNLFAQGDPRSGRSIVSMTAKELLDIGADRTDAAFARDPATELQLLHTLGSIYDALIDNTRAETTWTRQLAIARALYGPVDPHVINASLDLVESEILFQEEDKARDLLASIRAPLFALYGSESLQRAQWLHARAQALRDMHGGRDEAIADEVTAIGIFERHFPNDTRYPDAVQVLGQFQYDAERYAEAIATTEKAHAIWLARHAFDPVAEMDYRSALALNFAALGRLKEADAQLALVQAQAERQLGRQSLWYLHAVTSRAIYAHMQGDRARALALLQGLLNPGLNAVLASGLPTSARRAYAAALAREGRAKEAIPLLEATLAETRRHLHDEPNLRRTELMLGDAYDQAGRTEEARKLLLAARDEFIAYSAPGMPLLLNGRERWARFLLDHGETQAAAAEYTSILAESHGTPSAPAAMAEAGLARVALGAGATADAAVHAAHATALLQATKALFDTRLHIEIWLVNAQTLAATGRQAEARALAAQAVSAAEQWDAPASPQLARARAIAQRL